jgi:hypothetical protein
VGENSDAGPRCGSERDGRISAARIHDYHVINPCQTSKATLDVDRLILREDDRR